MRYRPGLGRSGSVLIDAQVGEQGLDFGGVHVFGRVEMVEADMVHNPVPLNSCLFGATSVALEVQVA